MFRLLVLVLALTACVAEEEAQASAGPDPIRVQSDHVNHVVAQRLKQGLARLRADLPGIVGNRHIDDRHRDDHHRDDSYRDDRRHNDRRHDDRRHDDRRHGDRHRDDRHRDHHDDGRWWEHRVDNFDHEEPEGPVILRSIRPDGHTPDIARQNKIIADVYSPDYAEPTWVLDYRYLKTGGRDYTRGPGGQIIILPKGIHTNEHKEFKNYDELIEHLRLKNLAERKKPQYFMPLGQGAQYDHDDQRDHDDHRGRDDHRGGDDHRGQDIRYDDVNVAWKHHEH